MARINTASVIIDGIKRRASIPENQATFDTADFLAFADEELRLGIVPGIMSIHEDYFLFEISVPLVSGKREYEIPSRAAGNKLRDLQYKPDEKTFLEMYRVGIGDRFTNSGLYSNAHAYYLKNNKVVVSDYIATGRGFLNFVFYIKPSQLVLEERIGVISAITDLGNGTTQITLDNYPENFSTNITYDLYKVESPNTILAIDLQPVALNSISKTVTFNTASIPSELKVGDHLSQAGEATIPQIPEEFHPMLEQMVPCRILEAQGDTQGLQNALVKLKQMETAGGNLIDNRVDDSPQKIVNRHGLLRAGIYRKYNRRY